MTDIAAYHFCAMVQTAPNAFQYFDGVMSTNMSPLDPAFYRTVKEHIANSMEPQQPPEKLIVQSLSRLTGKEQ